MAEAAEAGIQEQSAIEPDTETTTTSSDVKEGFLSRFRGKGPKTRAGRIVTTAAVATLAVASGVAGVMASRDYVPGGIDDKTTPAMTTTTTGEQEPPLPNVADLPINNTKPGTTVTVPQGK